MQLNVRLPDGVTPGFSVPVTLKMGSAQSREGVVMVVR